MSECRHGLSELLGYPRQTTAVPVRKERTKSRDAKPIDIDGQQYRSNLSHSIYCIYLFRPALVPFDLSLLLTIFLPPSIEWNLLGKLIDTKRQVQEYTVD